MKRLGVLGAALAAMLAMAPAGALAAQTAEFHYTARGSRVPEAEGIAVSLRVEDGRTRDRARISTAKNGDGSDVLAIRARESVPEIVRKAIADELLARGYALDGSGTELVISVRTFYAEHRAGLIPFKAWSFQADVALDVTAIRGGERLYAREVRVTETDPYMLNIGGLWSARLAAEALTKSLGEALDELLSDPQLAAALKPA